MLCPAFLNVVHQNQWHFLEAWDKTGRDRHVFIILSLRYFWASTFDSFHLNLAWPWVKSENDCHHCILRPKWLVKHLSYNIRAIFSCCDLIRPDLDLDLWWACAAYLYVTFVIPSVTIWQSLGSQLALVWSRRRIIRKSHLWHLPWPLPGNDHLNKFLMLHQIPLADSFWSPPHAVC